MRSLIFRNASEIPGESDPDSFRPCDASDDAGVDVDPAALFDRSVVADRDARSVDRAHDMVHRNGGDDELCVVESLVAADAKPPRSEERRVGKGGRSRGSP